MRRVNGPSGELTTLAKNVIMPSKISVSPYIRKTEHTTDADVKVRVAPFHVIGPIRFGQQEREQLDHSQ